MHELDEDGAESDNHLLLRSRNGDRHAFSELWRRHTPVAVAYARSLGSAPPDPEDVVSDAFVSILRQLRAGKGPQRSFRPYLLTTVKNTWMSDVRRGPLLTALDDVEHPPSKLGTIDVEAMSNSAALTDAFRSLPERWQHALWLSEVEQLPPREIAEVLHIRPNSAAALTYRARDALRKAWITAHLRAAPADSEHARVIELLGGYAHDDLSARSERFVAAHLEDCSDCRSAAGEARNLAKAMSLGPLLAGGAGLVIAPAVFSADQAAAAVVGASEVVGATDVAGWVGLPAAMQPALEAAGNASPLLWPVAAATAVALSISGSVIVQPSAEPEAIAMVVQTAAPDPVLPTAPPSAAAPAVSTPPIAAPTDAPAPTEPSAATPPAPPRRPADKGVEIITVPGWHGNGNGSNGNGNGNNGNRNGNNGNNGNGNGNGASWKHDDGEQGDEQRGDGGGANGHAKKDDEALISALEDTDWWTSKIIVAVMPDARSSGMTVAVWGAQDTDLAFLIGGEIVETMTEPGELALFDLALPDDDGGDDGDMLSVHYLDEYGQLRELAAQADVSDD